ncbi:MFS transporter [Lentisphaerota bacterium WC36G]|nr:MFS transporter [Lentisphaerae bacterium WC36]
MSAIKNRIFTKKEFSWVLYDVANSAFALIVMTAVFALFFEESIKTGFVIGDVENPEQFLKSKSTSYLMYANSIATFLLAISAPILGGIADLQFWKKRLLMFFTLIGVGATLGLYFIGVSDWLLAFILYILGRYSFAGSNIFYDAFLVDVVKDDTRIDWVSSCGYAFGYIGGVAPFLGFVGLRLCFNVDVQLSFLIAALWWGIFSIPIFLNVKQQYYVKLADNESLVKNSFYRLLSALKKIVKDRNLFLFLIAYFCYIDGVDTIFIVATKYGRDLGLSADYLLFLLVVVQLVAFPCAIFYGFLANKFGEKTLIYAAISVFMLSTIGGFFIAYIDNVVYVKRAFFMLGMAIASSQGGVQALSRSYFCRMVPKENATEFFGFYNIFGKFAVFLGPLIVGFIVQLTHQTNLGLLGLIPLFIAGIVCLSLVKEK